MKRNKLALRDQIMEYRARMPSALKSEKTKSTATRYPRFSRLSELVKDIIVKGIRTF